MDLGHDFEDAVQTVAVFMATGSPDGLDEAFAANGVVIIENFAPFLFEGDDALERWRDGFRAHVQRDELSELAWSFGSVQDFAASDDRAFFILPTTWTGRSHGRPFTETGGWAFVMAQAEGRWRIKSYAWAVVCKA